MIELAEDQNADVVGAIRADAKARGLRDPYMAYLQQRSGAGRRGIEWQLTFDEWWSFWDGSYHLRGGGPDGWCMARRGDVGPYALSNVYATTNRQNTADYMASDKQRADKAERSDQKRANVVSMAGFYNRLNGPHLPFEEMMRLRCAKVRHAPVAE